MNVYMTKLNGMRSTSTEQYAQHMGADIAHSLGIREMGIYRYYADAESVENRTRRFDGIIAGINAGDIVICQFPTWNGLSFERALVRHIKAYHGRIIIFIHDVEALMSNAHRKNLQNTVELYNEAEVLIVPSLRMQKFLTEHGIRTGMKFIIQEMWDYMALSDSLGLEGAFSREIHFAGNPDGVHFPSTWEYEIPLKVYSDSECHGTHVQKMGWLPPERLLMELAKGGFGLVWYGNEEWRQYLSMNNSLKLGVYLAAGIPVIVPGGISSQSIIEENHLGIAVDTLEEATETIKNMTEPEYREYSAAVTRFAPLIRKGFFTKKSLLDAVQMSMRNDMYTYSESNEVYKMSECTFEYVCLNQAYKDKLALSWIFRGEAEGFLVYDADSGELVGKADGLEHYLLLNNDSKQAQFIVKAYIRTIKGKLIVAVSDKVEVIENHFTQAQISLIVPAYNAEEFIARSIDNALAQSFKGLEILIINDGSTDRTQEVIDWYKEHYSQVRSIYQSNAGQAVARNFGVMHARGEYIGFMDSDDLLRPDMMEKLYDSIVKNSCDIAMTSAYQITNEGYEVVGAYPVKENVPISVDDFLEEYIRYAYPVVWNKLYRRSLVEEHPIPSVKYEDSAWTPCILSYASQVCYIDEPMYGYDRTIRNVTYMHTTMGKTAEEQYKDRRDYVMFFLRNGNPQKKKLLKKLALGYAVAFVNIFSYPGFQELRKEIEAW